MSKNYSPDADDQIPEKKSSQQMLLLLLMLLIVLFGYLYFFTGLIKPRGEQPKPQPVAETPVKSPLPPRPEAKSGAPAPTASVPAAKTGQQQAAAPAAHPATPAAPAAPAKPGAVAKEGTAPKAAPSPKEVAAAKPAPAAKAAPAAPAAKAAPASKPAAVASAQHAAPAAPAAQAKTAKAAGSAGSAAQAKKGAAPGAASGKEAKSTTAGKQPEHKAAAKTAAAQTKAVAKPAAYDLEVDGDLAESEVGPVLAKLKQAGIAHVVKSKAQKGEPMHRLFLADFANRDEASEELERLKLAAPNAFMLKENSRYAVYAGSYLREAKAANEQNRLLAKGVQLLLKSATAPVAVFKVRAGAFADQAGAERAAKALKKAGLSAKVAKLPKSEK